MGKKFYCIGVTGGVYDLEDADTKLDDGLKEFGNYFTSRAEAEKVLACLKAMKGLKDYGATITNKLPRGGTDKQNRFCGTIDVTFEFPKPTDKKLIESLFGGIK